MSIFVSTQDEKPTERFDAWRQHLCDMFAPAEIRVDGGSDFSGGSIRRSTIGSLEVSQVTGAPAVMGRTARSISAVPETDGCKIALQIQGGCRLEQGGKEVSLEPGDFTFFNAQHPFNFAYENYYNTLFVMFPRNSLALETRHVGQAEMVRMSGRQGLGALVSGFLTRLAGEVDHVEGPGAERLSDNVLGLLTTVIAQHLGQEPDHRWDTRRGALCVEIEHYIEQHLGDPGLTPTSVAAAHHVSTRYLHKVFEERDSTVGEFIRNRRLEKARHDLTDPLLSDRQVGAVGARWGLVDASQFSRLFKNAYGMSPRECRAAAALERRSGFAPGTSKTPDRGT